MGNSEKFSRINFSIKDLNIAVYEREELEFLCSLAANICNAATTLLLLNKDNQKYFACTGSVDEAMHIFQQLQETPFQVNYSGQENQFSFDQYLENRQILRTEQDGSFLLRIPFSMHDEQLNGELVIFDNEGKTLKTNQISSVKKIAERINSIVKNSQSKANDVDNQRELSKTLELLKESQRINKVGAWELEISTGQTTWTDEVYNIHEVEIGFNHNRVSGIKFYHPDDQQVVDKSISKVIEQGEPFDFTCRLITAKNNLKWVRSTGKPWYSNGKLTKLIGTFQDVTNDKLRENQLIESQQKFKGIFDSTFAFIGFLNTDGILLEANNTAVKMAGLQPEDVIGKYFWDCYWWQISEKAQKQLKENFQKALQGEAVVYEVSVWIANKEPVTILFSLKPVFDESGKVIYVIPEGRPIQDIVDARNRYKSVIESTNVGTWEWNVQTDVINYNTRWVEMLGYTFDELEPLSFQTWEKLCHPDDLEELTNQITNYFTNQKEFFELEHRLKHKDGTWVWVDSKGKIMTWTEDNKPLLMYGTNQDITKRKIIEEKLRISEQAFRDNFEYAGIGMAILNEKGEWLQVNNMVCQVFGFTSEELQKLTFKDITHPDDLEIDLALLQNLIDGKITHYQLEKRYFHKNGDIVNAILAASVVRDSKGEILYFIAQIIDVTDLKKAEKALEEALSKIQVIFDATTQICIIGTDKEGKITAFNKGAELYLGCLAEDIIGRYSIDVIHLKEEIKALEKELSEELGQELKGIDAITAKAKLGVFETREWTYKRKDGSTFPVLSSITPQKYNNEIVGFLEVATDISPIKKIEKEIRSVLEITNNQNGKLKNFAHIVSHNLRSHAGGISQLLDMLEIDNPQIYGNELIQYMRSASNNLSTTIKNLTEVIQINLSSNENNHHISIKPIINQNLTSLISFANQNEVELINEVEIDHQVKAIPAYLDSIIMNFVTNAIKYSSKERKSFLKITAETIENYVVISFKDNGLGIDLKKHGDNLFGMYQTFHNHEDSRGVGLFITKNQVDAMGGKIEVESQVNIGTTFKVYLPK